MDRISNTDSFLMAVPTPSAGMGINIMHMYIARNERPDTEKNKYDIYMQRVFPSTEFSQGPPYFTPPSEKIQASPSEEAGTVWIMLVKGSDTFKYDTHAALHILTNKTTLPSGMNKPNHQWEPLNGIIERAQQGTVDISERFTAYMRSILIPYLKNNHSDLLE